MSKKTEKMLQEYKYENKRLKMKVNFFDKTIVCHSGTGAFIFKNRFILL